MTGPTDFPETEAIGGPPSPGLVAVKDRLPLGVALLALIVAIAALVVAVGDSDGDTSGDDGAAITTLAPATTAPANVPPTTIGAVQTLPPVATTGGPVVTATTAAEPNDQATEPADDATEGPLLLSVVGISHDSTLNVRDEPGGQIVARLDSTATGILPTGNTQELSEVVWHEVHAAGVRGWVSGEYVTPLGATLDMTADLATRLGATPSAANLTALGQKVAGAIAAEEPESRVRISGEPTVGTDISQVTVDVVGQPDDSIRGYRLRVFAGRSAGGFTVRTVEATLMCYIERGVSAEGVCN